MTTRGAVSGPVGNPDRVPIQLGHEVIDAYLRFVWARAGAPARYHGSWRAGKTGRQRGEVLPMPAISVPSNWSSAMGNNPHCKAVSR